MKKYSFNLFVLWLIVLSFLPVQIFAAESKATFSQAELDQILAPIALYPDSLLSQILMAWTYPGNVAEAVKWSKSNPKQQGDTAVTDFDPMKTPTVSTPPPSQANKSGRVVKGGVRQGSNNKAVDQKTKDWEQKEASNYANNRNQYNRAY